MSEQSGRILASPKQRRGEIVTDEAVRRVFSRLVKKYPEKPADTKTNLWKVKPFKGVIRGNFHQSSLPHEGEVVIKNLTQYADYLNVSKRGLIYLIYDDFPNGAPTSSKTLADQKLMDYKKTLCHQYLQKHYENKITGDWGSGKSVDSMGKYLYAKYGQKDPALFTLEMFQQAKSDPSFYDETGKLKTSPLSHLKCIMKFAALQIEDSPLSQRRFQFLEGDEWYSAGLKNVGGKKDDYLQEAELKAYVRNINEPDTLVLHRLGLEGFGRISSQLLMGTKLPNGYLCQPFWDLGTIAMFEPKVDGSKSGGKVKRFFVPETMTFFKKYLDDFNIKGAWFKRYPSEEHNYISYSSSLRLAGLRADLWRYKHASKEQVLEDGEKVAPDGRIYKLKAFNNNTKGTQDWRKNWVTEGKMTTSHTVMKHTGVSLAGLHGFSLENCAQQSGTDATTLKDYYHGTLGADLQKVIMGEQKYVSWIEWVHDVINPLYTERYNELMSKTNAMVDLKVISQDEAAMAEVAA